MIPLNYGDSDAPRPGTDWQTREHRASVVCAYAAATLTGFSAAFVALGFAVGLRKSWGCVILACFLLVPAMAFAAVSGLCAWSANRYSHGAFSRRPFQIAVALLMIGIAIILASCAGLRSLR